MHRIERPQRPIVGAGPNVATNLLR